MQRSDRNASKRRTLGHEDLRHSLVTSKLGVDLGLVGTSEVHDGVNNDVVVLQAVLGVFRFLGGKVAELLVNFDWRVVELVRVDSGPSVEDGLEIGADALAVGVDLVNFTLVVEVLLEREGNNQQIDDQSLAVGVDFTAKLTGEFLQELGFFEIDSFFNFPVTVVQRTSKDDDFVFV